MDYVHQLEAHVPTTTLTLCWSSLYLFLVPPVETLGSPGMYSLFGGSAEKAGNILLVPRMAWLAR